MTKKYDVKVKGIVHFERTIPMHSESEKDAELGAEEVFKKGVDLADGDELTIESVTAIAPKFDVELVDGKYVKEEVDE